MLQTSELSGLMYQLSEFQYICEPEQALSLPFLRQLFAALLDEACDYGSVSVGFVVDKKALVHPN
jgi:hypothetical protein